MKKNGFTLIELLAVIVILAIIALIATPIILGIINDAREKANERSVELYASAVRNAVASYQLTHLNAPKSFDDLDLQYEGNITCSTEELYADGSFYLEGCKVNESEKEYTYGIKQQIFKPQYYFVGWDFEGTVGETSVPANLVTTPPIEKKPFLGYDVKDGKVSEVYACFTRNETQYCLKNDESAFETNKSIIEDAFKDIENACSFEHDEELFCEGDSWSTSVHSDGYVDVAIEREACSVDSDGFFTCFDI